MGDRPTQKGDAVAGVRGQTGRQAGKAAGPLELAMIFPSPVRRRSECECGNECGDVPGRGRPGQEEYISKRWSAPQSLMPVQVICRGRQTTAQQPASNERTSLDA